MEDQMGTVCAEGLLFFSKTNRLISHELKNILAIISETMGLMEELLALAEAGQELPPGKIPSLNASILEEIERANRLTRGMNTFAHTVDELITEVSILETVKQMIQLARLDADLKNISFQIETDADQAVPTSAFFLQNLIYRLLKHTLGNGRPEPAREVAVSLKSRENSLMICFSGLPPNPAEDFPTPQQTFLANLLSAELSLDRPGDSSGGDLRIILPKKPETGLLNNIVAFNREQ